MTLLTFPATLTELSSEPGPRTHVTLVLTGVEGEITIPVSLEKARELAPLLYTEVTVEIRQKEQA